MSKRAEWGDSTREALDAACQTLIETVTKIMDEYINNSKTFPEELLNIKSRLLVNIENIRGYYAPAVESEPVRNGRWIDVHFVSGGDFFRCSECGCYIEKTYFANDYNVRYCPNCGARMDATEEAIQHYREAARCLRNRGETLAAMSQDGTDCAECAAEHEQLAKWLDELLEKRRKVIVQENRIKELEADVNEQLAKRADAYNKLWDAYAYIDELIQAREESRNG